MLFWALFSCMVLATTALTDREEWLEFKQKHGKGYRSFLEERVRYSVFQENLRKIEEHNKNFNNGIESYYLGINQFADMTSEEFLSMLNYSGIITPQHRVADFEGVSSVPSSINWVEKGAVLEVKNQGSCGSCWAFSSTGALEGAYAIKTGRKVSLSEQNLMDCSTNYGNEGCSGGIMEYSFQYVEDFGIDSESSYPYKGTLGECRFSPSESVLQVDNFVSLPADSEHHLKLAVGSVGPVSVGVNAELFQFYSGGLFNQISCTQNLNHGVLVVGYGEENGQPYWLVKNSWGASWGEKGYIRMARDRDNQCGIASQASYPILK